MSSGSGLSASEVSGDPATIPESGLFWEREVVTGDEGASFVSMFAFVGFVGIASVGVSNSRW